jgi:hypothetical protein
MEARVGALRRGQLLPRRRLQIRRQPGLDVVISIFADFGCFSPISPDFRQFSSIFVKFHRLSNVHIINFAHLDVIRVKLPFFLQFFAKILRKLDPGGDAGHPG